MYVLCENESTNEENDALGHSLSRSQFSWFPQSLHNDLKFYYVVVSWKTYCASFLLHWKYIKKKKKGKFYIILSYFCYRILNFTNTLKTITYTVLFCNSILWILFFSILNSLLTYFLVSFPFIILIWKSHHPHYLDILLSINCMQKTKLFMHIWHVYMWILSQYFSLHSDEWNVYIMYCT